MLGDRSWLDGRFSLQSDDWSAGDAVLRAHGELDVDTRDYVVDIVHEIAQEGRSVRLDLEGVEFVDSSGLHALIGLREELGDRFTVAPLGRPLARVVEITGTAWIFE